MWRAVYAMLLLCALAGARAADLPRLLASHREMPGAWGATEVSSGMTVGPDGRIYFVTDGPRTTARLGCFDPNTQTFEELSDLCKMPILAAKDRVAFPTSLVFTNRGYLWFGSATFTPVNGAPGARLLCRTPNGTFAAVELPGESVVDIGYDSGRDHLYALTRAGDEVRFHCYDMKRGAMSDNAVTLKLPKGPAKLVMLRNGRAVIFVGGDIFLTEKNGEALRRAKSSLVQLIGPDDHLPPGAREGQSAIALAPTSNGDTLYGIDRRMGVLFAFDVKTETLRNLGAPYADAPVPETRMALACGRDGKLYFAGYERHQGQVGVYDPKTGEKRVAGVLAGPTREYFPPAAGCAVAGSDRRMYLAGFGWSGCGLFAFPPLPEKTPWSVTDRTYTCKHVAETAITLDGIPDEAAWKTIPELTDFVTAGPNPQPVKHKTVARVAWSDTKLYFAFRCETDGFKTAGKVRDDSIWDAECAELFVCPNGADAPYYEIDVNPDGVVYDSRVESYVYLLMEKNWQQWAKGWNGMETKTHVERDAAGKVTAWTMEAAVPFTAFDGGAPKPGAAWLFLPIRIAMTPDGQGEWACWESTHADFHKPHQFPKLKFSK